MELAIISVFIGGYVLIIFEHQLGISKTAAAILTGVLAWTIYFVFGVDFHSANEVLVEQLGEISGILFFLMAAMTLVEVIDGHGGFDVISKMIRTTRKRRLLWFIGFLTFGLSAVMDNLATTVVMILLLRKLLQDSQDRWLFSGLVVIAANAGGAWSPIGDVTTTMLWIEDLITPQGVITTTIIPSLVSFLIPLAAFSFRVKGSIPPRDALQVNSNPGHNVRESWLVFGLGAGALVLVPILKTLFHVPPVIGIFLGLGILWVVVDMLHKNKPEEVKHNFAVQEAIRKTDVPSVLFFFGIILAIDALKSVGILDSASNWLSGAVTNLTLLGTSIGLLSTVLDNIPLVAAAMKMYDFPMDHKFWTLLAYSAGTGGSILIIGSAAGLAAMGMEKIPFLWYLKNVSLWALLGFAGGILTFSLIHGGLQ